MKTIKEYKKTLKLRLRQGTLLYLINKNKVLLAMKKRGLGEGKWNGVGGKLREGESVEEAAIRETQEEIGVTPTKMTCVANLFFYSPDKEDWNWEVTVYECWQWEGKPAESEEMQPKWYVKSKIPYDQMWLDDKHWFPLVLSGRKVKAEFMFGKGGEIVDVVIEDL